MHGNLGGSVDHRVWTGEKEKHHSRFVCVKQQCCQRPGCEWLAVWEGEAIRFACVICPVRRLTSDYQSDADPTVWCSSMLSSVLSSKNIPISISNKRRTRNHYSSTIRNLQATCATGGYTVTAVRRTFFSFDNVIYVIMYHPSYSLMISIAIEYTVLSSS